MTYEEAKAEYFRISGFELTNVQEIILDTIYARHRKDPGWIIADIRDYRGDKYDRLVFLALAIENFRLRDMTYNRANGKITKRTKL